MQCPECLKLGIVEGSHFCGQECFKSAWKTHKKHHTKTTPVEIVRDDVLLWSDDMDDQELLFQANGLKNLVAPFPYVDKMGRDTGLIISSINSNDVTIGQRSCMFALLKENMKDVYDACSWGWDEKARFKDMSHSNSRFLIASKPEAPEAIEAFCMFRFDWDDEEEPEYAVLFVYELQVAASRRGAGLGRLFMSIVTGFQTQYCFKKTMLTCFKHNLTALEFYKTIGFGIDCNSPSCYGSADSEYEILSNRPKKRLA